MSNDNDGNVCIRCGKERIVVKTWKEKIGNSVLTYTETACPDKECQKLVEKMNQEKKDKREQMENNRKKSSHKTQIVLGNRLKPKSAVI